MTELMKLSTVRVALYTRVSTIEQAEEGYSIDEQERFLYDYCLKHNFQSTKCYSDRGISGKDIKHRPALMELLNDASEKKFDMVLSWKINRISRKLSDVLKIVDHSVLTNLEQIEFYENLIADITPLKEIRTLTKIELINNQIEDVKPLEEFESFEELRLSRNPITNIEVLDHIDNLDYTPSY